MAEKITYGIKNVYVAPVTVSDTGKVTYGVPKALPGASEISLSTAGEIKKVHADNIVYVKMNTNQGYDGNLSIYNIPNWFSSQYLGSFVDENGVLVEDANAGMAVFALMFEFNTDTSNTKRNVLYNVTASRPEISGKTKEDSIDPQAFSVPITASPAEDTEYVKASIMGDLTVAEWTSWYSSVYTPAVTEQQKVTISVVDAGGVVDGAVVVVGDKIATTDYDGKASFMLPNGTYDIFASASGSTAITDTAVVSGAPITKSVTLTAE